ncbi:MAG: histidinol dehydrogenase, partial [Clostridia bacterium]|nr:histidinol dehydrogenase [Clostridia bacterium]
MIRIMKLGSEPNERIFARTDMSRDVGATVKAIIEDVKKRGDEALFEYTAKFDGAVLTSLEVSPEEFEEARLECGEEFTEILREAAENIR